jgi:hypothetical protein
MKPYYDEGGITIYHGDCRDILPGLAADVLVTDPPYGTSYYPTDTSLLTGDLLRGWASAHRVVAIFGWPERLVALCVEAGLTPDEWITWWPTNGRGRGFNRVGLWREVECIAVFGQAEWGLLRQPRTVMTTDLPGSGLRGHPQTDMARMGDVWRDESPNMNPNQPPRLHPNEKPVSTMRRLLTAMTGGLVLDPCMGSGTTLRAAKDLGRPAIGIELVERHCEIAARRMGQEVMDFGAAA